MPSIFLSYSSEDREFTQRLATRLKESGVAVWMDRTDLRVGDSLVHRIGEGVGSTDFVGVVISRASIGSAWVQHEVGLALQREIESRRVVVLPILIEPCPVPAYLAGKKYVDFTDRGTFDDAFAELLSSVGAASAASAARADVRKPGALPIHYTRLLFLMAALAVCSVGLALWWKAPPRSFWQSALRYRPTPHGNTELVREIRNLTATTLNDTLVWQFSHSKRAECLDIVIVSSRLYDIDWEPPPEVEKDEQNPSFRNFNFSVFPLGGSATIGVVLKGSPPRSCLRLDLVRYSGDREYSILRGSLLLAKLRARPVALAGSAFAAGLLFVSLLVTLVAPVRALFLRRRS